MPQLGVNNEPLLERAVFGFDGSDYRVVKLDTDGNLVAAIKASQSIEVTQDTAANLNATVNLGGANEFGVVEESLSDTNLSAGQNTLSGTAVPTGQIYRVTNFAWYIVSATISVVEIYASGLASSIRLVYDSSPMANQWNPVQCDVILDAADLMAIVVTGATAGDDCYFNYAGERLK